MYTSLNLTLSATVLFCFCLYHFLFSFPFFFLFLFFSPFPPSLRLCISLYIFSCCASVTEEDARLFPSALWIKQLTLRLWAQSACWLKSRPLPLHDCEWKDKVSIFCAGICENACAVWKPEEGAPCTRLLCGIRQDVLRQGWKLIKVCLCTEMCCMQCGKYNLYVFQDLTIVSYVSFWL